MKPLLDHVTEHKKRQWQMPIIVKNGMLLWAHMQRLHDKMSPELREDLDQLLKYSIKITQSMIEIACMREWFWTAQAMIEFRASLVQGLDVKASELLQIPHFNDEVIKHCTRGKNTTTTLKAFLEQDAEQRKGIKGLDGQQLADVEAFVAHCTDPQLEAKVEVEDESEIVVGDIATVTVALLRKNLKDKEAMGPVHAPFFPEPKFEEWWVFLVEGGPGTRIIAFERIRDLERQAEVKLRFQVSRPGKHHLVVNAICDSYKGLDQKKDLHFNAHTEDEVKREIIVHSEDMDLDQQPTLFQQFMGELGQDEESEEEEEEDKAKAKPKAAARNVAKKEESDSDSSSSSSDSDSDDDDKKK
jgi:translocation protein SEC63